MGEPNGLAAIDKPTKFFGWEIQNIGVGHFEPHHQLAKRLCFRIKYIGDRVHETAEQSSTFAQPTETFSPDWFYVRRIAIRRGMKNEIEDWPVGGQNYGPVARSSALYVLRGHWTCPDIARLDAAVLIILIEPSNLVDPRAVASWGKTPSVNALNQETSPGPPPAMTAKV